MLVKVMLAGIWRPDNDINSDLIQQQKKKTPTGNVHTDMFTCLGDEIILHPLCATFKQQSRRASMTNQNPKAQG